VEGEGGGEWEAEGDAGTGTESPGQKSLGGAGSTSGTRPANSSAPAPAPDLTRTTATIGTTPSSTLPSRSPLGGMPPPGSAAHTNTSIATPASTSPDERDPHPTPDAGPETDTEQGVLASFQPSPHVSSVSASASVAATPASGSAVGTKPPKKISLRYHGKPLELTAAMCRVVFGPRGGGGAGPRPGANSDGRKTSTPYGSGIGTAELPRGLEPTPGPPLELEPETDAEWEAG
jgi:hypothetical protein